MKISTTSYFSDEKIAEAIESFEKNPKNNIFHHGKIKLRIVKNAKPEDNVIYQVIKNNIEYSLCFI